MYLIQINKIICLVVFVAAVVVTTGTFSNVNSIIKDKTKSSIVRGK